jgi:hypothetical protein
LAAVVAVVSEATDRFLDVCARGRNAAELHQIGLSV